jgi:hypothetical protein
VSGVQVGLWRKKEMRKYNTKTEILDYIRKNPGKTLKQLNLRFESNLRFTLREMRLMGMIVLVRDDYDARVKRFYSK